MPPASGHIYALGRDPIPRYQALIQHRSIDSEAIVAPCESLNIQPLKETSRSKDENNIYIWVQDARKPPRLSHILLAEKPIYANVCP